MSKTNKNETTQTHHLYGLKSKKIIKFTENEFEKASITLGEPKELIEDVVNSNLTFANDVLNLSAVIVLFSYEKGRIEDTVDNVLNSKIISLKSLCSLILDNETCIDGVALDEEALSEFVQSNDAYKKHTFFNIEDLTDVTLSIIDMAKRISFSFDIDINTAKTNLHRLVNGEVNLYHNYSINSIALKAYHFVDGEIELSVKDIIEKYDLSFNQSKEFFAGRKDIANGVSLTPVNWQDFDLYKKYHFYDITKDEASEMYIHEAMKVMNTSRRNIVLLTKGEHIIHGNYVSTDYEAEIHHYSQGVIKGDICYLHERTGASYLSLARILLNDHLCIKGTASSKEILDSYISNKELFKQCTLYHGNYGVAEGALIDVMEKTQLTAEHINAILSGKIRSKFGWSASEAEAELLNGVDALILFASNGNHLVGDINDLSDKTGITIGILKKLLSDTSLKLTHMDVVYSFSEGDSGDCNEVELSVVDVMNEQLLSLKCEENSSIVIAGKIANIARRFEVNIKDLRDLNRGTIKAVVINVYGTSLRFSLCDIDFVVDSSNDYIYMDGTPTTEEQLVKVLSKLKRQVTDNEEMSVEHHKITVVDIREPTVSLHGNPEDISYIIGNEARSLYKLLEGKQERFKAYYQGKGRNFVKDLSKLKVGAKTTYIIEGRNGVTSGTVKELCEYTGLSRSEIHLIIQGKEEIGGYLSKIELYKS